MKYLIYFLILLPSLAFTQSDTTKPPGPDNSEDLTEREKKEKYNRYTKKLDNYIHVIKNTQCGSKIKLSDQSSFLDIYHYFKLKELTFNQECNCNKPNQFLITKHDPLFNCLFKIPEVIKDTENIINDPIFMMYFRETYNIEDSLEIHRFINKIIEDIKAQ